MAPFVSIMPEYAFISLNMPEHDRILLNAPKCLKMPEYTVQTMPGFSICCDIVIIYNIIIIVTNVILECLSSQFVHPGALLPFYLF